MVKRGVKETSGKSQGIAQKTVLAVNAVLTVIGSVFVDLLEAVYHAMFIRNHELQEKGFTIGYHQNWITREIVEVTFRFKRAISDSKAFQFLHGVITRACSTMPVDVIFIPKGQKPKARHLNVCTAQVKSRTQFARQVSKARCIDPSCEDRSFEVWENKDARTFLSFHFPRRRVYEISVTGDRPMLRRVFHFA